MIAISLLIVAAACWPTIIALHERWTAWEETTYTHGWLIVAVSLFLLWRNRGAARAIADRTSPVALILLLGGGLLWAFAIRTGLVSLEWLLLPMLLWLGVWAAAGIASARRNLFAIGFLYFASPLWGVVNGLFLWMTVMVVRALLRLSGIPVFLEGNFVQLPAGVFEIAGGCSGLHFVVVGLALGALMGELRADNWRGRLKLLVLAGALAVVTNWVRVFTIILAGHYSDMQHYLVKVSHLGYGWVLFGVAMAVFFLIERRMALPPVPGDQGAEAGTAPRQPVAPLLPLLRVALVMGFVAILQVLSARPAPAVAAASGAVADTGWEPSVEGADIRVARSTGTPGGPVEFRQYIFLFQKQGKELGGYSEDPVGGDTVLATREALVAQVPMALFETRDAQGGTWLVAAGYSVSAHPYAKAIPAKVRYAWQSLLALRSLPAALTVWRTPCVPNCQAAEQALGGVITAMKNGGLIP